VVLTDGDVIYIDVKIGCKPQSLLTVNNFIDKIDEHVTKTELNKSTQ